MTPYAWLIMGDGFTAATVEIPLKSARDAPGARLAADAHCRRPQGGWARIERPGGPGIAPKVIYRGKATRPLPTPPRRTDGRRRRMSGAHYIDPTPPTPEDF